MAIIVEYGKCTQCNDNNPKSKSNCRTCGATLPWSKAAQTQISRPVGAAPKAGGVDAAHLVPLLLQLIGGVLALLGVGLWFGCLFGYIPVFSGMGYITGAGVGIFRIGHRMA